MKKDKLSQAELKKYLHYECSTGIFRWKIRTGSAGAGRAAGTINTRFGYLNIMLHAKQYRAHRLAWLYCFGYLPENEIDHINRNKLDNRIENLREATRQCNVRNTGNRVDNKSGVKGVSLHGKKWVAQIRDTGRKIYLGLFDDFTEAVSHRLAAEQHLGWAGCESSSSAYVFIKKYLEE